MIQAAKNIQDITINGRLIGPKHRPYIIAEMSGNHNHEIGRAITIIEAAKAAGADAVKLQTYTADTITIDAHGPEFYLDEGLWKGRRLYDLYKEAHTPWEWHEELFAKAREIGITLFSTPFDPTAADFLAELDAPAYKIASPELVDIPLIRHVARKQKPIIMSTGMATLDEISEAVDAARAEGCMEIVLLHCTSAYPASLTDANLVSISNLSEKYGVLCGLSDHTTGTIVATTAVACGAVMIEKHFTIARADGGVDSEFSLEPNELQSLVEHTNAAHCALGQPAHGPLESEATILKNRRSLYVVKPMRQGDVFNSMNVKSIRPSRGLPPKMLDEILGKTASRDISFGEPLTLDLISNGN